MKHHGTSASGMPVYSNEDAAHFLWRWFRLSWPAVLSGKFFDETGDTGGAWLCAIADLPFPSDAIIDSGWRGRVTVTADWPADVLIRSDLEDSELNPGQPFELHRVRWTLVVVAELTVCDGVYQVRKFRVRRTTREAEGWANRYGGDFGFHSWSS